MNVWVADAAPIIVLAKAELLGLIPAMTSELLLPLAVVREIGKGDRSDPARKAVEDGFGVIVRGIRTPKAVKEWGTLDRGERAAVSLCYRRGDCTLLCDDARGRKAADDFHIPKIGTLGVLLRAKEDGLLPALVPALRAIIEAGCFVDVRMLVTLAERVGEVWTP